MLNKCVISYLNNLTHISENLLLQKDARDFMTGNYGMEENKIHDVIRNESEKT